MKYYYSDATKGFYAEGLSTSPLPADAVEVTEARWKQGVPPVFAVYTLSDLQRDFEAAVQARVDALAKSWGYDSMLSLVSYRDDPHPRFSAEAEAGFAYRSATWAWAVLYSTSTQVSLPADAAAADLQITDALTQAPPPPTRPV